MKSPRAVLLDWGIKFIGIVLLIVLLRKIELSGVLSILRQFGWTDIILMELISGLVIITKALRFKILAGRYAIPMDMKTSTIIYGTSMFFSTITPGRIGDFIKVLYLKNSYGSSLRKGIYLSVVDRLFDLLTIALFAVFGLTLIFPVREIIFWLLSGLGFILLVSICVKKYLVRLIPQCLAWLGQRFKVDPGNIALSQLLSAKLILPALFSLIPNGLIFIQMIWIAAISQVALQPLTVIGVLALGNLISMLPITISGLGTRDATFVFLLGQRGITATLALTLSLAFFLFNNLGILVLSFLLFITFKPKIQADTFA